MNANSAIKAVNLSKRYEIKHKTDSSRKVIKNEFWALDQVSFEVQKGEVIGVIGKNGAGKSTLLKILSKITSPTNGRVELNGRVASLLEVGTGFHPELSGKENIFLNGSILGMSRKEIKGKLDEIIEFSGIEKFLDTPVKHYSSGMYVRLAFAVAAHLEPEILIIDEVLAVGDAEFQKKCLGKIKNIAGSGRTVLFVSHNLGAVRSLCTSCLFMEKGKLQFMGSTEEAIKQYISGQNQQSSIKLSEISNRSGNQKFIFADYFLEDKNNNRIEEAVSGDFLRIVLLIREFEKVDYNRLIFSLNFRDQFDHNVLSLTSDEIGLNNSVSNSIQQIEIEIPQLMLRGGTYQIRLLASEGGTYKEDFVDEIVNAFSLPVIATDHWNTGKVLRTREEAFMGGEIHLK